MLVIDASIAVHLAIVGAMPDALTAALPIAPPLLWSEASSALHELAHRGELDAATSDAAIGQLDDLAITRRTWPRLHVEAARIARQLGWARTYDAEYVALARLSGARLLTLDARLRRGAGRLVSIIGPTDLVVPG